MHIKLCNLERGNGCFARSDDQANQRSNAECFLLSVGLRNALALLLSPEIVDVAKPKKKLWDAQFSRANRSRESLCLLFPKNFSRRTWGRTPGRCS